MKKVYLLGDSVMKGVTFFGDPARYRLCPGPRYRELSDRGIEVSNISRMFATVEYAKGVLTDEFTASLGDSVVIMGFGGNDCDYDWDEVAASPSSPHLPKTNEDEFVKTYTECVKKIRSSGAEVLVASMVPINAERYMDRISEGRDSQKILTWLGDAEMLYRWHEHYNRLTERIVSECGCGTVDLRGAFLTLHSFAGLIGPDGIHPTPEGHKLIERVVTDALLAG